MEALYTLLGTQYLVLYAVIAVVITSHIVSLERQSSLPFKVFVMIPIVTFGIFIMILNGVVLICYVYIDILKLFFS